MTTSAPEAASARAKARPKPLPAPVTNAMALSTRSEGKTGLVSLSSVVSGVTPRQCHTGYGFFSHIPRSQNWLE
jgi:hypothetical protein